METASASYSFNRVSICAPVQDAIISQKVKTGIANGFNLRTRTGCDYFLLSGSFFWIRFNLRTRTGCDYLSC